MPVRLTAGIFARVQAPRLLFVLLFALTLLPGCAVSYTNNLFTRNRVYRKVRITDPQGVLLADWIAEGRVRKKGEGFRFKAVQRLSGPPYSVLSKYPQGRNVYVDGPNIVVMPCGKPVWLYELDGFGNKVDRTPETNPTVARTRNPATSTVMSRTMEY